MYWAYLARYFNFARHFNQVCYVIFLLKGKRKERKKERKKERARAPKKGKEREGGKKGIEREECQKYVYTLAYAQGEP